MSTLCKILIDDIPAMVARWERLVDREPWSALSHADRLDELPQFLHHLLTATVCSARGEGNPGPLLAAATSHGEQRRRLGLDYDHVMEESALLRRSVWQSAHPHRDQYHEMVRVDSALTVALMASLRGYARPELEARGAWEATLPRLIEDWSSLLRN